MAASKTGQRTPIDANMDPSVQQTTLSLEQKTERAQRKKERLKLEKAAKRNGHGEGKGSAPVEGSKLSSEQKIERAQRRRDRRKLEKPAVKLAKVAKVDAGTDKSLSADSDKENVSADAKPITKRKKRSNLGSRERRELKAAWRERDAAKALKRVPATANVAANKAGAVKDGVTKIGDAAKT